MSILSLLTHSIEEGIKTQNSDAIASELLAKLVQFGLKTRQSAVIHGCLIETNYRGTDYYIDGVFFENKSELITHLINNRCFDEICAVNLATDIYLYLDNAYLFPSSY